MATPDSTFQGLMGNLILQRHQRHVALTKLTSQRDEDGKGEQRIRMQFTEGDVNTQYKSQQDPAA